MIENETVKKLREMKFSEFIDIIEVQQKDSLYIAISFFNERTKKIIDYVRCLSSEAQYANIESRQDGLIYKLPNNFAR